MNCSTWFCQYLVSEVTTEMKRFSGVEEVMFGVVQGVLCSAGLAGLLNMLVRGSGVMGVRLLAKVLVLPWYILRKVIREELVFKVILWY